MTCWALLLTFIALCSLPVCTRSQRKTDARLREQTSFGAEEKIERPVALPADVLQALRRDEQSQACLAEGQSARDISASWFIASEINLNNDRLPDLIVMAKNPCLFGANVKPFWVFSNSPRGHRLVLDVSAQGLDVMKIKSNSYRNIRAEAATATTLLMIDFKFDGRKYRARRKWSKPID
jgi:hypothetical protein